MRIFATLVSAVALSASGFAVSAQTSAGGEVTVTAPGPVAVTTPGPVEVQPVPLDSLPLIGGLSPAGIAVPLLGAMVLFALSAESDGSTTQGTPPPQPR